MGRSWRRAQPQGPAPRQFLTRHIDESCDPIDVLNYAIEELGHTQAELAELLDSRSRASEILSRRRPLTVDIIHKISERWKIPADLLVRPYRIERAA